MKVIGEGEYCWPAHQVLDVIDALASLNHVILGAELWRFDDELQPRVEGWTDYEVDEGPWSERVENSRRNVKEELQAHSGDMDAWINITWQSPDDRGTPPDGMR